MTASSPRFRCHVGHAYNGERLLEYHSQEAEAALRTALRVLEEHAVLQERMGDRARSQQLRAAAELFHERSRESRQQAAALRKVLLAPTAASERAE